jgi:hypothetical protein
MTGYGMQPQKAAGEGVIVIVHVTVAPIATLFDVQLFWIRKSGGAASAVGGGGAVASRPMTNTSASASANSSCFI